EIDCSDLEIVDYTEATVACRGSVTLKAEASGTGSEIYWYDAAIEGEIVARGETFITPELTQTTSYWATEVFLDGSSITGSVGPIDPSIGTATGSSIAIGTQRMYFDVLDDVVIES